jgi:hypothetical protein
MGLLPQELGLALAQRTGRSISFVTRVTHRFCFSWEGLVAGGVLCAVTHTFPHSFLSSFDH